MDSQRQTRGGWNELYLSTSCKLPRRSWNMNTQRMFEVAFNLHSTTSIEVDLCFARVSGRRVHVGTTDPRWAELFEGNYIIEIVVGSWKHYRERDRTTTFRKETTFLCRINLINIRSFGELSSIMWFGVSRGCFLWKLLSLVDTRSTKRRSD